MANIDEKILIEERKVLEQEAVLKELDQVPRVIYIG